MLVDLDLKSKSAIVIGGGSEAELKAVKLLDAGASVTVIADRFTVGLRRLSRGGNLRLINKELASAGRLVKTLGPRVVFISTGKPDLDSDLASLARSSGALVCVVDNPQLNDFNMPALAKIGPLRVAISSGGKSPATVKMLRKRIEKTIHPEDLLQVELQHLIRKEIGEAFTTHASRRRMVYEIIGDQEVARLLKAGDLARARSRARRLIRVRGGPKGRS